MTMTVNEYHQRWQKAMEPGAKPADLPWYKDDVTRTSSIFFERAVYSAVGGGEGYLILPDFGDVICWYRYMRFHDEFEDEGKPLSPEDLIRKDSAQRELDALLERYVREGYQQKMREELKAIVEQSFREWELSQVYVLPEDLPRLLDARGDPRVPEAPAFDFENPEHCRALKVSLEL